MKNLTSNELKQELESLGACSEAIEWAVGMSLSEVWNKCKRPEWMLWYCERHNPVKRICVEISIFVARLVLKNYESLYPEDNRPRVAIESAEEYLKNPSAKTKKAAESAARSAESAARSAARSAVSAAWSAESAAWSAESAVNKKICDYIRTKIKVK